MDLEEFRKQAHDVVDWIVEYYEHIEDFPVKSQVQPGEIIAQIPESAPESPEPFEQIMADFREVILPGITHWQNPSFHAYFPGNSSFPSLLGEMLTSALGAQCMVWETSPAAAELEEAVINWLKEICGLPPSWHGVIQDTASTATLVALITAREKMTGFSINHRGFENRKLRIYASEEIHSSIDKAVKIAGFGLENLVKIPVDDSLALIPAELERAIEEDLAQDCIPCAVVGGSGTTGSLAFDPLLEVSEICKKYGVWFHVDAAYAGSAMALPEQRHLLNGLEYADSYVFNPHKWLFTNFDCTAYYVKDKEALISTFEILPEYLKTKTRGKVNDYRDWGIQLGRRFRALKLWIVLRTFGVDGIRQRLRSHIALTKWLSDQIDEHPSYELLTKTKLNMVVFRFCREDENLNLDDLNERILQSINQSGTAYITHTKVRGKYALRIVLGQTYLNEDHVHKIWKLVQDHAHQLTTHLPSV